MLSLVISTIRKVIYWVSYNGVLRKIKKKESSLETALKYAINLKLDDLVLKIKENKENDVPLFINLSCRDFLIDFDIKFLFQNKNQQQKTNRVIQNTFQEDLSLDTRTFKSSIFLVKRIKNTQIEIFLKVWNKGSKNSYEDSWAVQK